MSRWPEVMAATALLALAACAPSSDTGANETGMLNAEQASGLPANDAAAMPAEPVLPAPTDAAVNDSVAADRFLGRWTGPEGLYATITPGATAGSYTVDMQYSLDERGSFAATRQGDVLTLTRAGDTVRMVPGDGDATGMKWLAGRRDCLVVTVGSEGYCRD